MGDGYTAPYGRPGLSIGEDGFHQFDTATNALADALQELPEWQHPNICLWQADSGHYDWTVTPKLGGWALRRGYRPARASR